MNSVRWVDLGVPTVLRFSGPDSVRFLNGQITQDVRKVIGKEIALPSCVTDAKGRLQFRVVVTEDDAGALWVEGPAGRTDDLMARLTRYLIADEVEVIDLSGAYRLCHFIGVAVNAPTGVLVRRSNRFGVDGADWWIPCDQVVDFTEVAGCYDGDEFEVWRIQHGIPRWGCELVEGMLPPEALLESTDISYQKGCYIGQEVISRIKSVGKVNKRLTRFVFHAGVPLVTGPLENAMGGEAGRITSVAPMPTGEVLHALGYLKRGAEEVFFRGADGVIYPAKIA